MCLRKRNKPRVMIRHYLLTGLAVVGFLLVTAPQTVAGGPAIHKEPGSTRRVIVLLDAPAVAQARRQLALLAPAGRLQPLSQAHREALLAQVNRLDVEQRRTIARLQAQDLVLTGHRRYLYLLNGFAATVPSERVEALASASEVRAVYPDHVVRTTLGESVPLIGAPTVWAMTDPQGRPVRGPGIRVAVVAIRSSVPGGAYEPLSGTSMAAPHIAGGAAI